MAYLWRPPGVWRFAEAERRFSIESPHAAVVGIAVARTQDRVRFVEQGKANDMRSLKAARQHLNANPVVQRAARVLNAIRGRAATWLIPGPALKCPCCQVNLVEVYAIPLASKFPPPPFWRVDTRRILLRCSSCKHFHTVFAYPLFNWIPAARLTTEMALLNVLILVMILCASFPHSILLLVSV